AVIDTRMVKVDIRGAVRPRTGGDEELGRDQQLDHTVPADDLDGLLVGKTGRAEKDIDAIARVVAGTGSHLLLDDVFGAFQYIGKGKPARFADLPEQRVGVVLHDLPHRMTQRLGRNGPQVSGVAAYFWPTVDYGDLAPRLDRIHRRAFTRGPRTQYHHIVVIDSHMNSPETGDRECPVTLDENLEAGRVRPLRLSRYAAAHLGIGYFADLMPMVTGCSSSSYRSSGSGRVICEPALVILAGIHLFT